MGKWAWAWDMGHGRGGMTGEGKVARLEQVVKLLF